MAKWEIRCELNLLSIMSFSYRWMFREKNKDVFNSILKEFRKGLSEDIFIEINKINFPANKYDILTLDIK